MNNGEKHGRAYTLFRPDGPNRPWEALGFDRTESVVLSKIHHFSGVFHGRDGL